MIRNIVFDMGQVMIRFDPEMFMDRADIHDPGDRKLIRNELFRSVEWAQMDEGTLTEETAEPKIMARIPEKLRETVRELLYNWAFPREQIPGMSNASAMQPKYWQKVPASRYFDGTLISCNVHAVKPCKEIYRIFSEKYHLKPEECLFIDDAPANVAGAIACGWQGIVFHGDADELERKLVDFGINIIEKK